MESSFQPGLDDPCPVHVVELALSRANVQHRVEMKVGGVRDAVGSDDPDLPKGNCHRVHVRAPIGSIRRLRWPSQLGRGEEFPVAPHSLFAHPAFVFAPRLYPRPEEPKHCRSERTNKQRQDRINGGDRGCGRL